MTEIRELLAQAEPELPLIWLDSHAYAGRLLAGGNAPWLNATDCIAWLKKANGLLNPAVPVLPMAPIMLSYLQDNPALQATMASKSRILFPARTLLADEGLRSLMAELAAGLVSVSSSAPVALSLPSPLAFAMQAYALAHGSNQEAEFGEDEADGCAVYMADFLRELAQSGISIVLLEESTSIKEVSTEWVASYQAVINVARHYRWLVGLDLGQVIGWSGAWSESLDFVLASQPVAGGTTGIWVADIFWDTGQLSVGGEFLALKIPADANPEQVLERLSGLRA